MTRRKRLCLLLAVLTLRAQSEAPTDGSSLEVAASGALNDKLGGDLDAFNAAFSITNGAEAL